MNLRILLLFALFMFVSAAASAHTDAKAAVRVPFENYIKGHRTGDGEYLRKAFHTEGNLTFVRDGKYVTRLLADYIRGFTGKPAADEKDRKR